MSVPREPAEAVLRRLTTLVVDALGTGLLGLSVHGSWVAGDFDEQHSDIDLVAVLRHDPDQEMLELLRDVHDALDAEFPVWQERVEVDYVAGAAVRAALRGVSAHSMVRVAPGEPIHLLPVPHDFLLSWGIAREGTQTLHGDSLTDLLPEIPDSVQRDVLLDHLRDWPDRVTDMRSHKAQAYAVLTLCRAHVRLTHGDQVSKRRAATVVGDELPQWREVIEWALVWWYGHSGDDRDRKSEVDDFVRSTALALTHDGPAATGQT